jgi:hypothetical protein
MLQRQSRIYSETSMPIDLLVCHVIVIFQFWLYSSNTKGDFKELRFARRVLLFSSRASRLILDLPDVIPIFLIVF